MKKMKTVPNSDAQSRAVEAMYLRGSLREELSDICDIIPVERIQSYIDDGMKLIRAHNIEGRLPKNRAKRADEALRELTEKNSKPN
tara:strand:+ start:140 stop:397 length:258 start_codon:yes stop_codon:yes gene_type:complete